MKISRQWLQTYFDSPLPSAEALSDALTFHSFEIDGIEQHGNDFVLDVKITANRGHDCLSVHGIAKELSAILKVPLKDDPFETKPNLTPVTDLITVSIEDPTLCPRYTACLIRGVKVGPSPQWLKDFLEAVGQRSINNVVDATNAKMFNIGQPTHAFDASKIQQKDGTWSIRVRKAHADEKILALDEKEYTLNESMLVIADAYADTAIGIAGVKGGTPASISDATTDIIIESANFDGVSVRKTAQALKLRTDASARFEQGISPELTANGMRAVVDLILELGGGEVVGYVDSYPTPRTNTPVSVSLSKINNVLGLELTPADVSDVFTRLALPFTEDSGTFTITPSFERLDLVIPEDLIEEVGRIIGYDKVPAVQLPAFSGANEVNPNFYAAEHVREDLMSKGYSEVFTSVFAEKGERVVANKVDGVRPYLRTTLIDGLSDALKKNIPNKDLLGLKEIKLFEVGTVWKDGKEVTMVGTVSDKEKAAEKPLTEYTQNVGHPMSYIDLPTSSTTRYTSFSRYPYIVRDIAMWTPAGTDTGSVVTLIRTEAGELLQRIALFDTFTKADKTSLAFRLIFQSFEKTLTDDEVNQVMQKVSTALTTKGFEIR